MARTPWTICWLVPSLLAGCAEEPCRGDCGEPLPEPSADEALLRALMAAPAPSRAEVETALATIAARDGLPVATREGTHLFAHVAALGPWLLAGDFNAWVGEPMQQNGSLWTAERVVSAPDGAGYKFFDGGSTWVADAWARRFLYDDFGELSLVGASAAHLERWPGLQSHGLLPRTVRVWVPDQATFDRVLVAHDGQSLFDPEAPWGGWQLDSALPAEILVVAIDNTSERMDEYTHVPDDIGTGGLVGGRGDDYADFIELTVRPHVVARYGDASAWGLLGSSLGGLISLHVADRYPGSYAFAASLSGTMGWGRIGGDEITMIERYAAAGHRGFGIYLDSGGNGPCVDSDADGIQDDDPAATDNFCENAQLRDALANSGYVFDVDLWHWHEPGAAHNEAAWAARVWRPLQLFAGW